MIQGTITTCTERASKFGGNEKVCDIAIDGEQGTTRVYAKSQTKNNQPISYYPDVAIGKRVVLTPKQNGTGYFIQKVLEGQAVVAPNQAPVLEKEVQAGKTVKQQQVEYIETKAKQLKYAYYCLQNEFGDLLISEETTRAFASTIIISLDREGPK